MKLTTLLTAACAASTILLTACDDKPAAGAASSGSSTSSGGGAASGGDALAALKKTADEINADAKAMEGTKDQNAQLGMMKKLFSKLQGIKTAGLPADLKEALTAVQGKLGPINEIFAGLPDKMEDMAKLATDPAMVEKLQKVGTEIPKLMDEMGPLMEKLAEVAKKHGVNLKPE